MTPLNCLQCPSQNPRDISFSVIKQRRATKPLIQNVVSIKYLACLQLLPQPSPILQSEFDVDYSEAVFGTRIDHIWTKTAGLQDYIIPHLFESPEACCGRNR